MYLKVPSSVYLQSGVGNCGKDYGNGNKVKESDAKYSVTIGEASSKKFENFYTASTDTAKILLTELLEAAYDDGKSFTKLKAAFKKKLGNIMYYTIFSCITYMVHTGIQKYLTGR